MALISINTDKLLQNIKSEILKDSEISNLLNVFQQGQELINSVLGDNGINISININDSLYNLDRITKAYGLSLEETLQQLEQSGQIVRGVTPNGMRTVGSAVTPVNAQTTPSESPQYNPIDSQPAANYDNIVYNYATSTKRDKPVNNSLLEILSNSATQAEVSKIEIYSGKQPGNRGLRTGSGRHDTGLAADIKLIDKNGNYISGYTSDGRQVLTNFMNAAIKNGIRGTGFSSNYMGPYGIHVDTLGQIINTANSTSVSAYDNSIVAIWKSDQWFIDIVKKADSSYKYYYKMASGTVYCSKTNSNWSAIT